MNPKQSPAAQETHLRRRVQQSGRVWRAPENQIATSRLNGGLSKLSLFPNTAIERMFRENRDLPEADQRMFDFYNKL